MHCYIVGLVLPHLTILAQYNPGACFSQRKPARPPPPVLGVGQRLSESRPRGPAPDLAPYLRVPGVSALCLEKDQHFPTLGNTLALLKLMWGAVEKVCQAAAPRPVGLYEHTLPPPPVYQALGLPFP